MNTVARCLAAAAALVLSAGALRANSGVALIGNDVSHQVIGNGVIGVLEGVLLAGFWRVPWRRAIAWAIAANYVSGWFGAALVGVVPFADATVVDVRGWLVAVVVVAFFVTLVLEFPFVCLAFSREKPPWLRAAVATLAIHLVSYSALVWWFVDASRATLLNEWTLVPVERIAAPAGQVVYALDREGAQLLRIPLDGSRGEIVARVDPPAPLGRLELEYRSLRCHDLWLVEPDNRERCIARDVHVAREPKSAYAEAHGSWSFSPGRSGPLYLSDGRSCTVELSLETPLVSWSFRAISVAGPVAVAELTNDQVCLLDPRVRHIALLARGQGAVAVTTSRPR